MPRTYVDNAYNRSRGRVGMPVGSFVISRSGTFLGSQEYVDNYKNRSLVRVGLPRGSYPEGCSSWDTLSDKVVSPTYTKIHPDTNGRDKMQPAKEVTYKTKTKEAYDKKTATADNTPRDKIKTKETLTNLEILFDDNERLQIKLLEEKDKVALLEEERTNLRRKIDEKEKIIHITEEAKDAFRSRLDATEDTLAKKEEDFRLFKVKFEAMRKNEEQLARANQMLEDELIQQIQQERINTAVRQRRHHMKASFSQSEEVFSRSHITMSDNILQLQARVAERDDEIGKLKDFIQKQEDTIKALNRACLEEKERCQKLDDTIKALNRKYLEEKGTLKTKTIAHTRQLARYRQKVQEDADTKVKLYSELTNQQAHIKPDRLEECKLTESNPDKNYFVLTLKKKNQETESRLKQEAF